MSMVYSIADSVAVRWKGDELEQRSQLTAAWANVLDNMGPNVDVGDEALKSIV